MCFSHCIHGSPSPDANTLWLNVIYVATVSNYTSTGMHSSVPCKAIPKSRVVHICNENVDSFFRTQRIAQSNAIMTLQQMYKFTYYYSHLDSCGLWHFDGSRQWPG